MTDHTDDQILDALASALAELDPPPAHVIAGAKEALTWHAIDADLAQLVYDSQADHGAEVRGETREITFRAPGIEVEVMVTADQQRTLLGQIVPAQTADIELRHGGDRDRAQADTLGRFRFERVASGPVKLTVVTPTGTRVQTEGLVI